MRGGRLWHHRIQSIKLAPHAFGTAYAGEQGARIDLEPEEEYPALPVALSAEIESLQLQCLPLPAEE